MERMKFSKRIACLALAIMMAVPVASMMNLPEASTVEAAGAKKVTMYVGESVSLGLSSSVKDLKTSNKKVVKKGTYKLSSAKYSYIEAKKKGKSNVTFSKWGTNYNYNINVKKANLTADVLAVPSGTNYELVIRVNNGTKQTFETVNLVYTIYDAAGTVIEEKELQVYDVQAKSVAYKSIYTSVTGEQRNAGVTCTATVTPDYHDFTKKYKNVSDKVTVTNVAATSASNLDVTYSVGNKKSKYTSGSIYVIFYDANHNVVDVYRHALYDKKNTTSSFRVFTSTEYASYETVANAWYSKR